MVVLSMLPVVLATAWANDIPNMNGEYHVQNDLVPGKSFNTNFSSYPALGRTDNKVRYVEVYSAEAIETLYSQVWWTMSSLSPFPEALQKEFDSKVMAIVGYEFDQVIRNDDGTETPVPVTWSYNHHYSARVVGKYAEMYQVPVSGPDDPMAKHGGHLSGPFKGSPASVWLAQSTKDDPTPNSSIPAIVDFDEANGGEWRKSFHGYPRGYAQLVEGPIGFRIEPMQIDTRNRDGSMETAADGFVPDPNLVPKAYAAPLTGPDAVYSGLLECPCTDRITKDIEGAYMFQAEGSKLNKGLRRIATAPECFEAASKMGLPNITQKNAQGVDKNRPAGCSFRADGAYLREQSVFFNTLESAAPCGGTNATSHHVAGMSTSLVGLAIGLNSGTAVGNATITITGPADVWFGVALGATEMKEQPAAIIVDGSGQIAEYRLGTHTAGKKLVTQVTVLSNIVTTVNKTRTRTVILTRQFAGKTADHYTFPANLTKLGGTVQWMNAVGSGPEYSFHKAMSSASLLLVKLGVENCLCGLDTPFGSSKGKIIYTHDDGTTESIAHSGSSCGNSTPSDLIPTRNPRCDLSTYIGGLSCCHHKWMLTDREQSSRVSKEKLSFHMKVRIWFQEYIPATPTASASHELLFRMYHSLAGEYDVVKQTPSGSRKDVNASNVQVNEFKFKAKDMLRFGNIRTNTFDTPWPTKNQTGIKLLYINGHCHAVACIQFDLYNDDTGELLCRQQRRKGETLRPSTNGKRFDEAGYISLPPCLFGDREEGLKPPMFLSFETNLRSVKITNATYTHYGEMAHWQTRGVLV
jgi:hypothetical protein